MLTYDRREYFLGRAELSISRQFEACIWTPCRMLDGGETTRDLFHFASMLGWYKRGYVDIVGHGLGSHAIRCAGRGQPGGLSYTSANRFGTAALPLIPFQVADQRARIWRSLALWREGERLINVHAGYAFLSFYKVLECHLKGKERETWIKKSICDLPWKAGERVRQMEESGLAPVDEIYERGRQAIAHAQRGDAFADPDDAEDRQRFQKNVVVMRGLAERYIARDIGVPRESNNLLDSIQVEPRKA